MSAAGSAGSGVSGSGLAGSGGERAPRRVWVLELSDGLPVNAIDGDGPVGMFIENEAEAVAEAERQRVMYELGVCRAVPYVLVPAGAAARAGIAVDSGGGGS